MNRAKIKREIIGLALLVDELTDLGVFISYSPHVSDISIRVYSSKKGFSENSELPEVLFHQSFYYDFQYEEDEQKYQRIKDFLTEEIRKATEIPLRGGE